VLDATTSTSPSIPVGPIVLIHAISNGTNELAITLRSGSLTYASARSTASRVPAGFAERYRIKSGKTACYQARAKGASRRPIPMTGDGNGEPMRAATRLSAFLCSSSAGTVPADTRSDGAPASCAGSVHWQDEPRRLIRSAGRCPLAAGDRSITDSTEGLVRDLSVFERPPRRAGRRFIRAARRIAHRPTGALQALEQVHVVRPVHPSATSRGRHSPQCRGGHLVDGRVERRRLSLRQQIRSLAAGHRRPGGVARIFPPSALAWGHRSLVLPGSSSESRRLACSYSHSPFEWRRQTPTIPAQHTRRCRGPSQSPAANEGAINAYCVWPFDGN
jgi:hypothetical protein